jgi:hypothetical protein
MLNNKKGIGLSIILKLVLGFMVLGMMISVMQFGALGEAIFKSFGQINNQTDTTIEIQDKDRLSQLLALTRMRGVNGGCNILERINDGGLTTDWTTSEIARYYEPGETEGYPALEGTYLTQKPDCFGGSSTFIREGKGAIDTVDANDNYMPGVYSRERFEIKKQITIEGGSTETFLENKMGGVWNITPQTHGEKIKAYNDTAVEDAIDFTQGVLGGYYASTWGRLYGLGEDITGNEAGGVWVAPQSTQVARNQIYFLAPENAIEKRVEGQAKPDEGADEDEVKNFNFEGEIFLCPGDEGYVQASRGMPDNGGQSSKEPLYPIIVIEKAGEDCN